MLDIFRKRSRALVTNLIILAVAAVMTVLGVGRMQNDNDGGADGAAAYVNDEIITRREFAQEYEYRLSQYQQMLGGQMDERFLKALQIPKRTLDEMIQYRLLSQQAKKLGIEVPDTELADFIRGLPYFQKNGKFDPALYSKLPERGMEEKRQRDRLRVVRFQGYLSERIRMTPVELRRAFDLKETKVDLQYARINFKKVAKERPPTPAEIETYLAKTSPDELAKQYEEHRGQFTEPAKVELRQIRIAVPFQASPEKKNEAKGKIMAIHPSLTRENFAKIAKEKSDDEYAKKGGLVGWINRGTLEPALEQALENLEPGKISAPIATEFGHYILLVENKKDRVVKPLEQVERQLAEKVLKQTLAQTEADKVKASWEEMLKKGQPLDNELKKYKVEIKKTGPFALGSGTIPQLGQVDEILDSAFQLSKSAPIAKQLFPVQDDYVYVKLLTLETPKAADFEKTWESVEKTAVTPLQSEFFSQLISGIQKTAKVKINLPAGGRSDGGGNSDDDEG